MSLRWLSLFVLAACGDSSMTSETSATSTDASTSTSTSTVTAGSSGGTTQEAPTGGETTAPEPTSAGPTSAGEDSTSTGAATSEGATEGTTGAVEPPMSLDEVVDGELELIADGHMFTEGPQWSPEGFLLYTDIPADTIFRWAEGEGSAPYASPSGNANGLAFDGMGRLLAARHGPREVARFDAPDMTTALAGAYMGQKLNSPNDLVVRSDGTIYFTDPPYGIAPNQQELGFQGVFRIDPQGQLSLVAQDFDRPNGIALSPDESRLYVDDTALEHVRVFAVEPDGAAVGGEVFVDLASDLQGDPDGMAVDVFGDLYVTGGGGVRVVTPDGVVLGTIAVPESATNCAFGDPDGMALFITAPPRVYRQRLKVAGIL